MTLGRRSRAWIRVFPQSLGSGLVPRARNAHDYHLAPINSRAAAEGSDAPCQDVGEGLQRTPAWDAAHPENYTGLRLAGARAAGGSEADARVALLSLADEATRLAAAPVLTRRSSCLSARRTSVRWTAQTR